jgi:hypothetical protein
MEGRREQDGKKWRTRKKNQEQEIERKTFKQ